MKTNRYIAGIEILKEFEASGGVGFNNIGKYLRGKGVIRRDEILKSIVYEDIPEKKIIVFTLSV